MTIGIDATNLRLGGGITHIKNFLINVDKINEKKVKIILWGNSDLLKKIDNYNWLTKIKVDFKNTEILGRIYWQYFTLSKKAEFENCSVLFIPGGSYIGKFSPVVTMSRNMLPFEYPELLRYGFTLMTFRLLILRFIQKTTFRRADGLIFLTKYAKDNVLKILNNDQVKSKIIPHGVNKIFYLKSIKHKSIKSFSFENPFKLIYVSIIDVYKHQSFVAEAISSIRSESIPVSIDFIGPYYKPSLKRFSRKISQLDPNKQFLNYHGNIKYELLPDFYNRSNMAVFASSCENMPNILLEMMASGLPVACSNRGPMPEIYGSKGCYFDPENPKEIEKIILKLILNVEKREKLSKYSLERAKLFRWRKTTSDTLSFMKQFIKSSGTKI